MVHVHVVCAIKRFSGHQVLHGEWFLFDNCIKQAVVSDQGGYLKRWCCKYVQAWQVEFLYTVSLNVGRTFRAGAKLVVIVV